MRTFVEAAGRLVLGAVFLWAGLSKLADPLQTLAGIYAFQIGLPDNAAVLVAVALPWFEILLGLCFLGRIWWPETLAQAAWLLSLFLLVTAQAWWRGLPIDCGCMNLEALGIQIDFLSTPAFALARNLVLLAWTVFMIARPRRPWRE